MIPYLGLVCTSLTISPHAVVQVSGKDRLVIRTMTCTNGEEDTKVEDFSHIYRLRHDDQASIRALQKRLRADSGYSQVHASNIRSAKEVLTSVKDGVQYKPGTIVWAFWDRDWWPARVRHLFMPANFRSEDLGNIQCIQVVDMSVIAVPPTVSKLEKPALILIHYFDDWDRVSNDSMR